MRKINQLLKKLKIEFNEITLYETAMTHSSFAHENNILNNERLEFLGDAVIELLMSNYLYTFTEEPEGEMTKRRAQSVCEEALVVYADQINLADYLLLGKGELQKGANDAMIADALEALFGAIYLDLGFDKAWYYFNELIVPHLDLVLKIKDYKTTLQELVQVDKRTLVYQIIHDNGPSHNKTFEAVVKLDSITMGTGIGKTKKEAEQNAARKALQLLAKGDR